MKWGAFETPVGKATAVVNENGALVQFWLGEFSKTQGMIHDESAISEVRRQVDAYFAGERTTFDVPLAPVGTPFQRQVWDMLLDIPYGETRSYGSLAEKLGDPQLARAVGAANGSNPIWLIVPCHRVIGAGGALTGYAGGIEVKRFLLQHEGALNKTLF